MSQRTHLLEDSHPRVHARSGPRVTCDAAERATLNKQGHAATWRARHHLALLHLRYHFTHAAATDGSRTTDDDTAKVACGYYTGVTPLAHLPIAPRERERRAAEGENTAEIAERLGHGLWGAALPTHWTVADAECYAIYAYLRHTLDEIEADGLDPQQQRLLIVADNAPILEQIEQAWRAVPDRIDGRAHLRHDRKAQRSALIEAITNMRRQLGGVWFVWVPAHSGITMNAYADAAAKAHLDETPDPHLTRDIADQITTRPCLYGEPGTHGPVLRDRRAYRETWERAIHAARRRIGGRERLGMDTPHADPPTPRWTRLAHLVTNGRTYIGKWDGTHTTHTLPPTPTGADTTTTDDADSAKTTRPRACRRHERAHRRARCRLGGTERAPRAHGQPPRARSRRT